MEFAIMNNTPLHFIPAGALLATFLWAIFFVDKAKKKEQRGKALLLMHFLFVLVLLSGCYVWTLVPFSLPLLIKSVGGCVLYWTMVQLVKRPLVIVYWILFAAIAAVGLTLAFTMI